MLAVSPSKPVGIHVSDGRDVLVEVLRVRVASTEKGIGAARCGVAPEGYEVESPEQATREAAETRAANRERSPDWSADARDESIHDAYPYRSG